MNIQGQSGLSSAKQNQIETFLIRNKVDVLHLQEVNIIEDSFSNCNVIENNFQ